MIIRECYVDDLGGSEDQSLESLRPGLNVIRGPEQANIERLSHFIPAMLLGESERNGIAISAVSGSLVTELDANSIELVRVNDDPTRALHMLDAQGRAASDCPIPNRLSAMGSDIFLSLYTDRMSLSNRLQTWQRAGITEQLVGAKPSAPVTPAVDQAVIASSMAEIEELRSTITAGDQQRKKLQTEIALHDDAREQYLTAKKQQTETSARSEELHHSIHQARQQLELLNDAFALATPWARRAEIQAEVERLQSIRVHPKDLKRVRELDRQLQQLRQRLRDLRNRLKTPPQLDAPKELPALLQAESNVRHQTARIAQIQLELAADRGFEPASDHLADIRCLESAAAELTAAQSRFDADHTAYRIPDPPETAELPVATPIDEYDAREVRGRIETLKAQTRELLHGRVLSPPVILALGALFSCGVAMILGALVFDFGGYNLSIGVLGMTGTVAATLLKISFERPALEELQQHRERIDQLLAELKRVEHEDEADTDLVVCEEIIDSDAGQILTPFTRVELDRAEQSWHDLLSSLDLPRETSLSDAIELLQLRSTSQGSVREHELHELEHELVQHQRSLAQWQQQAASCLDRSIELVQQADIDSVINWLRDLKTTAKTASIEPNHELKQEIAACQQELKQHKRKRNKIFARAGVDDLDQLRERIQQRRQISPLQVELQSLEDRINGGLADDRRGPQITELLQRHNRDKLQHQTEQQQATIQSFQKEKAEVDAQLKRLQHSMKQFVSDRSIATTRQQLAALDHRLANQAQQLRIQEISLQLADGLKPPVQARSRSEGLEIASRLRNVAGHGKAQIEYDVEAQDFVCFDDDVNHRLRELGEADARLTLISLQLAAIVLQNRHGLPLPAIFTDESFGQQPTDCSHLAKIFRAAAEYEIQIFVFTSRGDVEEAFAALDVPTTTISLAPVDDCELAIPVTQVTATPAPEPPGPIEPSAPIELSQPSELPPLEPRPTQPLVERESHDDIDWIPVEYQVANQSHELHDDATEPPPTPPPRPVAIERPTPAGDTTDEVKSTQINSITEVSWDSLDGPGPTSSIENPPIVPLISNDTIRADRSNTPPSKWHRLDAAHTKAPAVPNYPDRTTGPQPQEQPSKRRLRPLRRDEMPEWWPD